ECAESFDAQDNADARGRPCGGIGLGISTCLTRVPNDLPQVPVGILEIAMIAAPKRILTGLDDPRPGLPGRLHHFVDLIFAVYKVADAEFGGARWRGIDLGIKSKVITGENGEFHPCFELEEGYRTMLELCSDDPFRGQPQTVAVELH